MSRMLARFVATLAIAAALLPAAARATDVDGPNDCQRSPQDFGDAPEGTALRAYIGVVGRFPTCVAPGPVGTLNVACAPISTAPGPAGFVKHINPAGVPPYWLGCGAAAPLGIDSENDGKVNNSAVPGAPSACSDIPTDCVEAAFGLSFGQDECWGSSDAGVLSPNLRTCRTTRVSFRTTNCATAPREVFLNILVDLNHDGDWNDNMQCVGACAYEWAVKNALITLPPGCATLVSPAFLVGPNEGQGWMRVTISSQPVNDDFPWAGSATMGGQFQGGETEDYPVVIRKPAVVILNPVDISWVTLATGNVRFHLTFRNEDPTDDSESASGRMMSQPFGVFAPDHGQIGTFSIPPLQPNSFFDVFFDVQISQLPPTAVEVLPWTGMMPAKLGGASPTGPAPGCPPDDHWDGNVDIHWSSASDSGHVNKHIGTIQVCPTHGNSYIHTLVFCGAPASWAITGLCPGWSATLVNEGPPLVPAGPAPNPVPAGWTGFICISADASVPPGATCPIQVTFTCNGVDGVIDLEPVACDCSQQLCDAGFQDFGDAPEEIAAYPSGISGHFPTCLFDTPPGTQTIACGAAPSTPPGLTGFVRHVTPATVSNKIWLGCGQPGAPELGRDSEPNGKVNIDPPFGLASVCDTAVRVDCFEPAWFNFGQDECYGTPDACLASPMTFHRCADTTLTIALYNCGPNSVDAHLNLLVDWSMDGDWNDVLPCAVPGSCIREWVAKNIPIVLAPGCNTVTIPVKAGPRVGESWMRITLTPGIVNDDFPWAGSRTEPNSLFLGGETEDYPVRVLPSLVDVEPTPPGELGFAPLTPNPSRNGIVARFTLPRDGDVELVAFDVTGRAVRILATGALPAGEHARAWDFRDQDGRSVPAGLYLLKLRVGTEEITRRVIRLE